MNIIYTFSEIELLNLGSPKRDLQPSLIVFLMSYLVPVLLLSNIRVINIVLGYNKTFLIHDKERQVPRDVAVERTYNMGS